MIGLDIILGGVTGLLGNGITSYFKYKNAKMEYTHKEKMVDLETKAMIKEAEMQIDIAKSRIEGEVELADVAAFETSQKTGSQKLFHEKWIDMIMEAGKAEKWYSFVFKVSGTMISASFAFVDWLNAMMRPTLTLYLVGASSYITLLAWKIMKAHGIDTITAADAVDIFNQVSSTMIFLSVSCVTWWFGDRSVSKFLQQQEKKKPEEK
ncbi:hypothetical protein KAR91_54955 [Candidatus Pacearchaeota archaeon]|nr:hypothetical protein [Candidatus Pacearchaeota archaeon]